jgi:hypothetical protein
MFPLVDSLGFAELTDFVIAFVLGVGFGFFLEQAGFGNADKLAMQFYFRDMTVFKVMFAAIVTTMTGLIVFSSLGLLDLDMIYINPTYLWSGIVGGLIMGFGFIIGGYCPGTALVGVMTARIDAIFSVLGGMLGMFLFAELVPIEPIAKFFNLETEGFSGQLTLWEWLGVKPGVVGFFVMIIALLGFVAAEWAERKFNPQLQEV